METPLDTAFRAAEADPGNDALRLAFHERILDAELLLLLAGEPADGSLRPEIVALADGRFALAFDRDDRLAGFVGAPAPFAALSGRRLAGLLAGQGIGLALNLGAASESLLPAEAVDWIAGMAAGRPAEADARLLGITAPAVPEALARALAAKLAAMADVVATAHLVEARYAEGSGLLLALVGVPADAEAGVAAAVAEAVRFSDAGRSVDVTFLDPAAPGLAPIARAGHRFDFPRAAPPAPPGSDPTRPPRLR